MILNEGTLCEKKNYLDGEIYEDWNAAGKGKR